MLDFDPKTTALVLIDLQKGIVGRDMAPHSGPEVVAAGRTLAESFRAAGAPVVLVRVAFAADFADAPKAPIDQPMAPPPGGWPADWTELVDGLAQPGDILVVKHHWGAFGDTDLDLQLRRRGINTLVLGGIATNFGVESTAREAWQLDYSIVVAEDATASVSAELHDLSIKHILPRLSRVRTTHDIRLTGAAS